LAASQRAVSAFDGAVFLLVAVGERCAGVAAVSGCVRACVLKPPPDSWARVLRSRARCACRRGVTRRRRASRQGSARRAVGRAHDAGGGVPELPPQRFRLRDGERSRPNRPDSRGTLESAGGHGPASCAGLCHAELECPQTRVSESRGRGVTYRRFEDARPRSGGGSRNDPGAAAPSAEADGTAGGSSRGSSRVHDLPQAAMSHACQGSRVLRVCIPPPTRPVLRSRRPRLQPGVDFGFHRPPTSAYSSAVMCELRRACWVSRRRY
jgi:hypothetical protein